MNKLKNTWTRFVGATKFFEKFWYVRGIILAFTLLSIIQNYLSLSTYESLRIVHAVIMAWSKLTAFIGVLIGKIIFLPELSAEVVNAILLWFALGIPTLIFLYRFMSDSSRVEPGKQPVPNTEGPLAEEELGDEVPSDDVPHVAVKRSPLSSLIHYCLHTFFYVIEIIKLAFIFIFLPLIASAAAPLAYLRLFHRLPGLKEGQALTFALLFFVILFFLVRTFPQYFKAMATVLVCIAILELFYFLNFPGIGLLLNAFADSVLGPSEI